jgi:tRNA(Ile)-lysidine synthase
MVDLETQVRSFIQERRLLSDGERVLAAVSGGPDSLCLMAVLQALGYNVRIAHFDHGLRKESAAEARFVQTLAGQRGLPFAQGEGDVRGFAKRHRKTLEEAARLLRYEFLAREARRQGVSVIATGHTREDQAETVLMHLLRGAGGRGLSGIQPSQDIRRWFDDLGDGKLRLIRPILDLSRAQTEEYCRRNGMTPVHDATNRKTAHWRNRIRLRLIPELKKYNPRIIETLARLADLQSADRDYLDGEIEHTWQDLARTDRSGEVRIRREEFMAEATAIRRGLIRRAMDELLPGNRDFAKRHVDQADTFAGAPTRTGKAELALGVTISLEKDWLVFRFGSDSSGKPDWDGASLPVPGKLEMIHPEWEIETDIMPAPETQTPDLPRDPWLVWMDFNRLTLPLTVRLLRPGEQWKPLGMSVSVDLADFLAKRKMNARQRKEYPLIGDQQGVCWVPGVRASEDVRVTGSTGQILRIVVNRNRGKRD